MIAVHKKVLAPACVDDYFSVIVDTRTCKLETKHSPSSFVAAMDAAGTVLYIRTCSHSRRQAVILQHCQRLLCLSIGNHTSIT